ncbi:recombination mediator RecR [Salibacter halophilus]|uniref:Recombination protein RecR n=1 Tax=Salibacter halophilus TaxID=1803916 RepID=A0A6N6M7L9_9FLAO|nr:recombination mediator RecR [Salibacter halophilus]KAB1064741.1 recombination protein RecR [Salibacter halophilus]
MELPSKYLMEAVEQFNTLPGIGKKTALRLAVHMLGREKEEVEAFSRAFSKLKENVTFCKECGNISDREICDICSSSRRNRSVICVVEDLRDVLAIENTQQYDGLYHVLGGHISPMDGIGPGDLNIDNLLTRAQNGETEEIVLALSTTMEGDSTNFYLYKKLQPFSVNVSTIARGVAIGDELEYTDEVTLGRSIVNRMPYESSISRKE